MLMFTVYKIYVGYLHNISNKEPTDATCKISPMGVCEVASSGEHSDFLCYHSNVVLH